MEIDGRALRLLRYLAQRVTMTVGDNAPRVAEALGMSEQELRQAADLLFVLGLATDAALDAAARRWAVTDAGLAYLDAHGPQPRGR